MNEKQLWALRTGAVLVLLMSLFPPWRGTVRQSLPENVIPRTFYVQHEVAIGYAFAFAPPTTSVGGVEVIPNTQQIKCLSEKGGGTRIMGYANPTIPQ